MAAQGVHEMACLSQRGMICHSCVQPVSCKARRKPNNDFNCPAERLIGLILHRVFFSSAER